MDKEEEDGLLGLVPPLDLWRRERGKEREKLEENLSLALLEKIKALGFYL